MKKYLLPVCIFSLFFACSPKLSPDHNWKDRKWILYEISGVPVQLSGTDKDAHLVFSPDDKRFSGSGGCNRITGSYEIDKDNKLKFGDAASTKMMCPDMAFENNFFAVLKTVDTYAISGKIMLLKSGDRVVMKLQ